MVTADIWPLVDIRPLPESAAATTAAATEDDAMDVTGDTTEADTTLEETTILFDGGTIVVVVVEEVAATAAAVAAVATVTATPAEADTVAALLRPFLREADIGAVTGAAGGGRLLTKGLLLSRSARR